jgi:hypothetical protein
MSLRPRIRKSTVRTVTVRSRAWGLAVVGKRHQFLGFVEAKDGEAARAALLDELNLSPKQRKRLVVQGLPGRVRAAPVSALSLNDEQRGPIKVR